MDMGDPLWALPAESAGMFRALQMVRETVYLRRVDDDGTLRRFALMLALKRGCRR